MRDRFQGQGQDAARVGRGDDGVDPAAGGGVADVLALRVLVGDESVRQSGRVLAASALGTGRF